ncbi:MAG: M1 family metallopeptidase [Gammaproteobacteria bacterium]|nr:M1 family metallopeptidase [Gammaproteobacteria bacterium]MDH4310373.1 M1 family metallopeptidase [Gammaproteobacteria bacterium]
MSRLSRARKTALRGPVALVALALLAVGCQSAPHATPIAQAAVSLPASAPILTTPRNWPDTRSHADPLGFVTRSFDLDLDVDFEKSELRGTVTLELDRVDPGSGELVLDTRDLQIESVKTAPAGSDDFRRTRFALDRRDDELGSALRIAMPRDALRVRIAYATTPQASGLQWLQPSQTAGKQSPFLFSQAQALHARSMAPLQDTPWIRATYTATLRVPAGMVAVMAAEGDAGNRRGQTTFHFRMPQPIPSYLLALAVGDLDFRAIGPRTGVWAEPSRVAAAAKEFEDVETMLTKTEALYGPYRWGRYDVLMLPPSFPYGGMENPRLTFMTPTVIAGDKSLVGVLAHELAHSWSGNLVTNATWRDGWLNEGFTTYFERRIMETVYGEERGRLEWGVGQQDLRLALAELKPDEAWQGVLAPDLSAHKGEDSSAVAYEKGALFLYQLERRFGRPQLDAFLQGWFDRHAFTSVTTPQFVAELQDGLMRQYPGRIDAAFLASWIDGTGLPADAEFVQSDTLARVEAQRMRWEQGSLATDALQTAGWTVQEWLHFLNRATRPQFVTRLQELDRRFQLTASPNAEIAHSWFRLALASGYPGIEPALEGYLAGIGRLKLIEPLYEDLLQTPQGAMFARRVYAQARPGYHAIAQRRLDRLMQESP